MIVLVLAKGAYSYTLPDMFPIAVLTSDSQDTDVISVLTSVATDSLTDAGISEIELYQDSIMLDKKNCHAARTCTFSKIISEMNAASHVYYSKAVDLSNQAAYSQNITINFKGARNAANIPIILEGQNVTVTFPDCESVNAIGGLFQNLLRQVCNSNYSEYTEEVSFATTSWKNVTFDADFINLDNDNLNYGWKVRAIGGIFSNLMQGTANSGNHVEVSHIFNETGNYEVELDITDNKGSTARKIWNVSVEEWSPPAIYGQAIDIDTGEPLAGINVSAYSSSIFNPETNNTAEANNYDLLQPKSNPDTATDSQGRYEIYMPTGNDYNHLVFQGSSEKDFNVKDKTKNKIVLPRAGQVRVYFESASAFLKSDLYIISPTNQMLVANSSVGNQSYIGPFNNGTELKFSIKVHGQPMNLGEYFHDSNSTYAKITQIDNDTWRLYFEDLPSNKADWDYNDVIALVDMAQDVQNYTVDLDCDQDGVLNWQDTDDSWCDVGEHETEISENISTTNFNAEGHITHSGKYENGNKYTCGDFVYFIMFGVNNGGTDETITFDVQDHTQNGNPDSPILYYGDINNQSEILTVPAGQKLNKLFKFKIPCSYGEGKYDIHVLWNNETWHKIGNFFVVPDVTMPYVFGWDSLTTYTNQSLRVPCDGENLPQPGTIGYNEQVYYFMMEGYNEPKWGVTVCVDKDINTDGSDNDGIKDNDKDGCMVNPPRFVGMEDVPYVNYSKSGHYVAKIFAFDDSGNTNSTYTNITVYATEEEVNATAQEVYSRFFYNGYEQYNYTYWIASQIRNYKIAVDRWDINATNIGDEYITPNDGFHGPNGINYTEIAAAEEANFHFPLGQFVKPIYSMTLYEYNYTLTSFCYHVMCNAGQMMDGQPDCHSENFVPQILRCTPYGGPTGLYIDTYGFTCIPVSVTMNSTSTTEFGAGGTWGMGFEKAVMDPNNDPVTVQWYLDGNRVINTADTNYTYMSNDNYTLSLVGNSSLIGNHKIKVMAFDYSGMNLTIPNGPSNSHEWDVIVT